MEHVEKCAGGVVVHLAGRQESRLAEERASGPVLAGEHVEDTGQLDGEGLSVVGGMLEWLEGIAWLVAVHVPAEGCAGPGEDGIDGAAGMNGDREVGFGKVRAR